jgi:nucleoside-diphosphate-sugar epimerase
VAVLITGGDGFVARATRTVLVGRGHRVIGSTRGEVRSGTVRVPDIGPDTDWTAALEGTDTVVHLAARVHISRERVADPLGAFRRVNRDGTARLVSAAGRAGVHTFIFASTIGVVCERSDEPVTEGMPCVPETPYAISKLEAELMLLEEARMRIVIIRPPMVYGRDAPGNFARLVRAVASGIPLPLGAVRNRRSFISVENLASALSLAVEDDRARGVYHVADGPGVSTADFVRMIADALGRKPRLLPVPRSVLHIGAQLTGMTLEFSKLLDSLPVDSSRFRRDVAWQPPLSMQEGVRACLSSS